jgi:uncharacterized protein (UPF0548 family)
VAGTPAEDGGRASAPHYAFPPGSVLNDLTINGYRREQHVRVLPTGLDFVGLRNAILAWAIQRRSGIQVLDATGRDATSVRKGLEVQLRLPLLLSLHLTAPVRVLEVLDTPTTVGFVYATLLGHPERGEEAFLLHHTAGGTMELELRVLSRPAMPFALAAPMARIIQAVYTRRYLNALP